MTKRNILCWGVSALALSLAAPAFAEEAAEPAVNPQEVEAVVVTAQKRAENVQTVPLSIIAVSGKQMEAKGIDDVVGLERTVPNLRLDATAQQAGVSIRIRGFGAASNFAIDPSVAPYIDGAFIPRPGAALSTFLDVETVEALRGPQGTLFGRNATVGALSVRTRAPSFNRTSGKLAAEAGNYGSYALEGMINHPLGDTFAVRLAALHQSTDGFIDNKLDGKTYGEKRTSVGRLSAKWAPTENLTWVGRADYALTTGDGVAINQVDVSSATPLMLTNYTARLFGNPSTLSDPPSFNTNQKFTNLNLDDRQYGLTSDVSAQFGGGYTLRLIDALRDWKNAQSDGDVVFTTLDLLNRDGSFASKAVSHELQLISPKGAYLNGKLDFVSGLYYFNEDYDTTEVFNLGSQYCSYAVAAAAPSLVNACNAFPAKAAANGAFNQGATSKAFYVQANYALTPSLDLVLGARKTWDDKDGHFVETLANPTAALVRAAENTTLAFKDSQPSWRASLNWKINPDVLAFLTWSTGYKSGGFNSAGGQAALGQTRLFDSETSDDIELGVKSLLLDHTLKLNATLYRTELHDFQDRSFNGVTFIVRNAGDIRAQGLELEGQWKPTSHVGLDFGLAYLDSTFTANTKAPGLPGCTGAAGSCPTVQDLTGKRPTFSPEWQGNLGAEYVTGEFAGGLTASFRADANYTSSMYTTNDLNPQGITDGVTLYGARITLNNAKHDWNVALFGENLSNEAVFRTKFPQVLDSLFGVRNATTGQTLMRGFMNTPMTWGVRATKNF
jgi:iron complex outermembrane receptor protein